MTEKCEIVVSGYGRCILNERDATQIGRASCRERV